MAGPTGARVLPAAVGTMTHILPIHPRCPGTGGSGDCPPSRRCQPAAANCHGGGDRALPAALASLPLPEPRGHRPLAMALTSLTAAIPEPTASREPLPRGPSVLFLAGLGLEGGYTTPRQCQQPGDLAPRRLHRGHPGSPSRAGGQAEWGAQGTPAWLVEMGGLSPRPGSIPAAPTRTGKPLGPAPRRTGLNWCGGGEAGLGLGWQRLARAGEAMGGEQAGAGRSGQGPRAGAAGAGASGQATAGLVPVPIPAGPPRRPVSRGRVVWQPPARPPAAALGALASAAGGPFPTRPARGWLRSPPSTARTGTPQPPNPEDVRTRPSWWDRP